MRVQAGLLGGVFVLIGSGDPMAAGLKKSKSKEFVANA